MWTRWLLPYPPPPGPAPAPAPTHPHPTPHVYLHTPKQEFLAIPELSINPLAQRLVRLFECCNFKVCVTPWSNGAAVVATQL